MPHLRTCGRILKYISNRTPKWSRRRSTGSQSTAKATTARSESLGRPSKPNTTWEKSIRALSRRLGRELRSAALRKSRRIEVTPLPAEYPDEFVAGLFHFGRGHQRGVDRCHRVEIGKTVSVRRIESSRSLSPARESPRTLRILIWLPHQNY